MSRYLARLDAARALRSAAFIVSMRQRSALFDAPHCAHVSTSSSRGWRTKSPVNTSLPQRQRMPILRYSIAQRVAHRCPSASSALIRARYSSTASLRARATAEATAAAAQACSSVAFMVRAPFVLRRNVWPVAVRRAIAVSDGIGQGLAA